MDAHQTFQWFLLDLSFSLTISLLTRPPIHCNRNQVVSRICDDFHEVLAGPDDTKVSTDTNLILLQAYILGDRLTVPTFRRHINNAIVNSSYVAFMQLSSRPRRFGAAVAFAFSLIPHDRAILQFLVNNFYQRLISMLQSQEDLE